MGFPSLADEVELHERVLQKDPVAHADVFKAFMDPILRILQEEDRCSGDDANDSAIDALFAYLGAPQRYDRSRARLSTYLIHAAKRRAMDRRRSREARDRREREFAVTTDIQARNPKDVLDAAVEARRAVDLLETIRMGPRELLFLKLILQGESSTAKLAEVLGKSDLPEAEQRREVKRHRDRLMKMLERLGREHPDDRP
ncbi:sigma factor [Pyxidicoccus sp. 3LG]